MIRCYRCVSRDKDYCISHKCQINKDNKDFASKCDDFHKLISFKNKMGGCIEKITEMSWTCTKGDTVAEASCKTAIKIIARARGQKE